MTITVTRDRTAEMRHVAQVRAHRIPVDELAAVGGEDSGPTPHDLYDAALASCKALTVLWYANRKGIPVEDIAVTVERDDADERKGTYRLRTSLALTGPLTAAQRRGTARRRRQVSGAQADDAGRPPRSSPNCAAGGSLTPMPIEQLLPPRAKDLGGGFTVRRLLPAFPRQAVGPFVFFDHFGPITTRPGRPTTTCGRIRTSVSRRSLICSRARCCTGTAWAACSASSPARSTG